MQKNGFTMIELVFVIVILGILAAVSIPTLAQVRADAETSQSDADAQTCSKNQELWDFDSTQFPGLTRDTLVGC